MPLSVKDIARAPRRVAKTGGFAFDGFPLGLNSFLPPQQISKKELAESINYKITEGGRLATRAVISKYTDTATSGNSPVLFSTKCPIGSTDYELMVDENRVVYYVSTLTPTAIGTLEGEATLMPFNGVVLCLDGSYIKYLDGVTTSSLKICYDDGTGTNGYQYNNLSADDDTTIALGNATNTRVAAKFTSQAWDSGYTIPPTTVTATLQRVGNGFTGTDDEDITAVLRLVSNSSVLATKTLVEAPLATNVASAAATEYSTTFASTDITTEMSQNVAYYLSIEYDNGDATNYIKVHCETVASGGVGYAFSGALPWFVDTTKDPNLALRPGRPPKGSFGTVYKSRPFIGGDPDNPGYLWYGNLTHLDWSTSDGGGYVGLVDGDSNNFPVGAVAVLYAELFAYGKKTQPVIARLIGATPSGYTLTQVAQKGWATHKTLKSTIDDLWGASGDGISPLAGVQEYGDVRLKSASDPIKDKFEDYWDTDDTISEYYSKDSEYWTAFPSYHRVQAVRTKSPVLYNNSARYPATEYEFYRDILTSSTYRWVLSGNGTNEYQLQTAAGADPSIDTQPDFITLDGDVITEGTAGSLGDLQWDRELDSTSTYQTIHIRDDSGDPDATGVEIRSIFLPKSFSSYDGDMAMGGSDGFLYKTDSTEHKDMGSHQIKPKGKSKYVEIGFGYSNISQWQVDMHSDGGAGLNIKIYTNNQRAAPINTWALNLSMSDLLTLADMDMTLGDADFAIAPGKSVLWKRCNLLARSFQVSFEDAIITNYPLYVKGFKLLHRSMQR